MPDPPTGSGRGLIDSYIGSLSFVTLLFFRVFIAFWASGLKWMLVKA